MAKRGYLLEMLMDKGPELISLTLAQPCRCESASELEQCTIEVDNRLQPSFDRGNADERINQLFGGSLTVRDYDGQVAEAQVMIRALNRMTKAGMSESVSIT